MAVKSMSMRNISIKVFYGNKTTHCIVSAFYERHSMVIYLGYVTFQELIQGSMKNNLKDR